MRFLGTTMRLVAVLALLLAVPLAATAKGDKARDGERRGPRHHSAEARLGHLSASLDLSAAQQEQLRPILEDHASEMRAIKERKHAGDEDWDTLRETNSQEIESILDEQQIEEYRHLRGSREHHLKKRHKGRKHEREHKRRHEWDRPGSDPEASEDPV